MSGTPGKTVARPGYDLLREKARGYLPGWSPRPNVGDTGGGPIDALLQVAGRYHDILDEAIARSVEKARLAHLGVLGQNLRPPVAASGWVAFTLDPAGADSTAPAGSRLGANVPGAPGPVVFETSESISLAAASLVEIVTVDPKADQRTTLTRTVRTDLPSAADAAKPPAAIPPENVAATPHELYLGHPSVLALTPGSTAKVQFVMDENRPGALSVTMLFELFDGSAWRQLNVISDETGGLVRSGKITLGVGPFASVETTVQGVRSHWLRVRIENVDWAAFNGVGPTIRRVQVASTVEPASWSLSATTKPKASETTQITFKAFDEEGRSFDKLDDLPTLSVVSLAAPGPHPPAFLETPVLAGGDETINFDAKTGDEVDAILNLNSTVVPKKGETPPPPLATLPLTLRSRTVVAVEARRLGLALTKAYSDALPVDPLSTFAPFGENPRPGSSFVFKQDEVLTVPGTKATLFFEVLPEADDRDFFNPKTTTPPTPQTTPKPKEESPPENIVARTLRSADEALTRRFPQFWPLIRDHWILIGMAWIVSGIGAVGAHWGLTRGFHWMPKSEALATLRQFSGWFGISAVGMLQMILTPLLGKVAYGSTTKSKEDTTQSTTTSTPSSDRLDHIVALEARTASGWTTLHRSNEADFKALNLDAKGLYKIPFDVPEIVESTWAGETGRWMRLRLVAGGYATISNVAAAPPAAAAGSSPAPATGVAAPATNPTATAPPIKVFTPMPPRLHAPRLTYRRDKSLDAPTAVFSNNDDVWTDLTPGLNQSAQSISPFTAPSDETAALYLGFAGALPSGSLGLGFVIDDDDTGSVSSSDLVWEYHNGATWSPVEARDGTGGLSRSGIVRLTWPTVPEPPNAPFLAAEGSEITFADGLSILDRTGVPITIASAYPPPISAVIRDADGFERIDIVAVTAKGLALAAPLSRAFKNGRVEPLRLSRFGTPRTWVRVRHLDGGTFPDSTLRAIHPNAVAVMQWETRSDEVLGSGDGTPRQAFRLSAPPVLEDEWIEIRELSGHRAEVESQVLEKEVIARGLDRRDFRLERDPITGKIVAAWVRWRSVPDLGGSEPHDRVYAIDAARGQVVFGDDRHGRIPPPGANSIVARSYRTDGGRAGNVAAAMLNQVLSSLPNVVAVGNPQPTSGGADGESLEVGTKPDAPDAPSAITQFLAANPASAVLGGSGLSLADMAALARSASSQVIGALALRDGPGRVRLVIIAQDDRAAGSISDDDPEHLSPSVGLKARVGAVLKARMPQWGAARMQVVKPNDRQVAVAARVQADATKAGLDLGDLRRSVERVTIAYLDPRTGGPEGLGWLAAGGATVSVSDLARQIAKLEGVDRILEIALSVAGGPPVDRVVLSPGVVAVPDRTAIRADVVLGNTGGTSS